MASQFNITQPNSMCPTCLNFHPMKDCEPAKLKFMVQLYRDEGKQKDAHLKEAVQLGKQLQNIIKNAAVEIERLLLVEESAKELSKFVKEDLDERSTVDGMGGPRMKIAEDLLTQYKEAIDGTKKLPAETPQDGT